MNVQCPSSSVRNNIITQRVGGGLKVQSRAGGELEIERTDVRDGIWTDKQMEQQRNQQTTLPAR